MRNETDIKLMFKFLEKNYPVSRVKHKMRFKRAIILDDGTHYFLSDPSSQKQLMFKFMDILKQVFDCDEISIRIVLNNFLHLD